MPRQTHKATDQSSDPLGQALEGNPDLSTSMLKTRKRKSTNDDQNLHSLRKKRTTTQSSTSQAGESLSSDHDESSASDRSSESDASEDNNSDGSESSDAMSDVLSSADSSSTDSDNETVSDGPYSYIRESCLTYRGKYTPQLNADGTGGEIGSFCTVSDGTCVMTVEGAKKVSLYHIDASYKYINKHTIVGLDKNSALLCLNKHEAIVCTDHTKNKQKIRIVSLGDEMRVTRTFDLEGSDMSSSTMAYLDGDFYMPFCNLDNDDVHNGSGDSVPSGPVNKIDVYSVTGKKVRTIEYKCGKDDEGELLVIEDVHDIVVREDRIVLSATDNEHNMYILCLEKNGERISLKKIGKHYKSKISLCMDERCNIYYIAKNKEIHRVTACGDEVLLKYVGKDVARMCIDVKRQMLYLMHGKKNKTVHAYHLCGRETRY